MSDLRLPVEVEPPSEQRWDRIAREMFARLDASPGTPTGLPAQAHPRRAFRRRVVGWMAIAAAAAVVAAVLAHPRHIAGGDHRARLETGEGASQFTVGESSLIVAPRSLVMVDGDDEHGVDVVLDRGTVTCVVAPRRGRPAFVVDAGDVRVRVVGTKFTVAREGGGASVDVDHGIVEVVERGVVTSLHDGEHWPAAPSGPLPGVQPPPEQAVMPDTSTPGTPPGTPAPHSLLAPPRGRPAAQAEATSMPFPMLAPVRALPSTALTAASSGGPAAAINPAPAPPPQEQFELATKIERARPDDAMAAYRQVVAGGSAWAPNALFALARLEADRGLRADAAQHLQEYLARYPRGINADDARALLQRMQ